jgi:hypothetical protein
MINLKVRRFGGLNALNLSGSNMVIITLNSFIIKLLKEKAEIGGYESIERNLLSREHCKVYEDLKYMEPATNRGPNGMHAIFLPKLMAYCWK